MQTGLIVIDHPKQNRILAALPVEEYARLLDDLELIALELGHVLYEPGDSLKYIYFPTTCIVPWYSPPKAAPRPNSPSPAMTD